MRLRPPVLALALVLAGCGDDGPGSEERREAQIAQLAEDLRDETSGALDQGQATCVARELVDSVGADRFEDVVAAAAGDGDPDLRDQVVDVFAGCDALDPVAGS